MDGKNVETAAILILIKELQQKIAHAGDHADEFLDLQFQEFACAELSTARDNTKRLNCTEGKDNYRI
jgi:hypothetical protein